MGERGWFVPLGRARCRVLGSAENTYVVQSTNRAGIPRGIHHALGNAAECPVHRKHVVRTVVYRRQCGHELARRLAGLVGWTVVGPSPIKKR